MAKTSKKQTTKAKAAKTTKRAPKIDREKVLRTRYPHIVAVTEVGKHGKPTRVEIECTTDDCNTRREIATQDAFQVQRCSPCQREFAKARRRKTPVAPAPKPKSPKARTRKPRKRTAKAA